MGIKCSSLIFSVTIISIVLLSGCSHNSRIKEVTEAYNAGDFSKAAVAMKPVWEKYHEDDVDAVIFDLEEGSVSRAAGEFVTSITAFNEAWDRMSPYYDSAAETKVTEEVASAFTNQVVRTYRGTTYDRIMSSTYQALNYLDTNQAEKAGVEFVRARNWQVDAVERERKRIDDENEAWKSQNSKGSAGYNPDKTLKSPTFQAQMNELYGPMSKFQGYADYEIPAATWMRGVFYFARGEPSDFEQARQCFVRVAGMLGEKNGLPALADAQLAENVTTGKPGSRLCYVILESGLAPSRREIRLDIPIFLADVPYVGAAFPALVYHENAVTGFTATHGSDSCESKLLTDMDAVVTQDFQNRLGGIIVATLISSATKAAATYGMKQAMGDWGAVAGVIYQVAMNSADLRTWTTLPKAFYYGRLVLPESAKDGAIGEVTITLSDGRKVGPFNPGAEPISVVYIKSVAAGTPPAARMIGIPQK